MKLTTFIMLVFLLQVAAAGNAQITIRANKASLQSVLEQISEQSGYDFVYSDNDFKNTKVVNVKLENAPLEKALQVCFTDQPLTYQISEKTVIVKRKEEKGFVENLISRFQPLDVRGRVIDEKGEPLPGANVRVKNGKGGATANAKGEFVVSDVADDAVLQVSFIGYVTKEVAAKAELGDVVLSVSDSKLDEVQVIAYGKQTQRKSLGNVTTITAKDIEKSPVSNPILALSGRVAGLDIRQNTGMVNGGVSVRVQGTNSLNSGSDPLYIVDGVPYPSQMLKNIGGIFGDSGGKISSDGSGNPLSYINPNDIESISVLRDADATAIYGSRAANGAILITTKRGKLSEAGLTLNLQQGVGEITRKLKVMNTQQYLEMRKEAFANDKVIPSSEPGMPGYAPDLTVWDKNRYTDWQEELIGSTAQYSDFSASLQGGNPTTRYTLGGTFHRETTVFPGNFSDKKASLHFGLNNSWLEKKLNLDFKAGYLIDINRLPSGDYTNRALTLEPNAPALRNPDGTINWMVNENGASLFPNPISTMENIYLPRTNNLIASSLLSYNISNGLEFRTNLGYNVMSSSETALFPLSAYSPDERPFQTRFSSFNDNRTESWILEPQLNYDVVVGHLKIGVLLGTTFQNQSSYGKTLTAIDFPTDELMKSPGAAVFLQSDGDTQFDYRYTAMFSRLQLDWKNKYLLNLAIRRDGSSRFGPENRFHAFGSIAGGWIFSEENLIKNYLAFLSFGKIRASYGTTGNDQIENYLFLDTYGSVGNDVAYQGGAALGTQRLFNPYLQWEETKKFNFGVDLGFVNDRIIFNANYYDNRSSNQLARITLPFFTGQNSITQNRPAVIKNSGFELGFSLINVDKKSFKWSTSLNFTVPKNKLVSYENFETSNERFQYVIGKPVTAQRVFKFEGVNSETGFYQFRGSNGEIIGNPDINKDRYIAINMAPSYYGGLTNTISYKNFSLDFLLSYVKQNGQNLNYAMGMPGLKANSAVEVLSRWRNKGDISEYQRFNMDYSAAGSFGNVGLSDAAYTDASYLRLKNLSLGYNFSSKMASKAGMSNCKLFFQGQNILTFTNFIGLDPESRSVGLPVLRVMTFGLQASF